MIWIEIDRPVVTVEEQFNYILHYKLENIEATYSWWRVWCRPRWGNETEKEWLPISDYYPYDPQTDRQTWNYWEDWSEEADYDIKVVSTKNTIDEPPNFFQVWLYADPAVTFLGVEPADGAAWFVNNYLQRDIYRNYVYLYVELKRTEGGSILLQPEGSLILTAKASLLHKRVDKKNVHPLDVLDYELTLRNPSSLALTGKFAFGIGSTGWEIEFGNVVGSGLRYFTHDAPTSALSLHNVKLIETIPAQTEFLRASDNGVYSAPDQTVTWNLDDWTLAPGASQTFHCFVEVTASPMPPAFGWRYTLTNEEEADGTQRTSILGFIDNTVELTSDEVTADASASATMLLGGLSIKKTADRTTVAPNRNINYTITYENFGLFPIDDVTVRDRFEEAEHCSLLNIDPSAASAWDTPPHNEILWTVGTLDLGAKGTASYNVLVKTVPETRVFPNDVTIAGTIDDVELSATTRCSVKVSKLWLDADPAAITVGSERYANQTTITAFLTNDAGEPVAGEIVIFSVSPPIGQLSFLGITGPAGTAVSTYIAPDREAFLQAFPDGKESVTISASTDSEDTDSVVVELSLARLKIAHRWKSGAAVPWEDPLIGLPGGSFELTITIFDHLDNPVEGAVVTITEPGTVNPGWSLTETTDASGVAVFDWFKLADEQPTHPICYAFEVIAEHEDFEEPASKLLVAALTPSGKLCNVPIPHWLWVLFAQELAEAIAAMPGIPNWEEWAATVPQVVQKLQIIFDETSTTSQKNRAWLHILMDVGGLVSKEAGADFFLYVASKWEQLWDLYGKKYIHPTAEWYFPESVLSAQTSIKSTPTSLEYMRNAISVFNGIDETPQTDIDVHSPITVLIISPSGYLIGSDPDFDSYLNELQLTSMIQTDGEYQRFSFYDMADGVYLIRIVGTGEGNYTFDITVSWSDYTQFTQTLSGTTTTGQVEWGVMNVDLENRQSPINCTRVHSTTGFQYLVESGDVYVLVADAGDFYVAKDGSLLMVDASASKTLNGSIEVYEWDWDNDGVYDASSPSPTMAFTRTGSEPTIIQLKITDDKGNSATDTAIITSTIQEAIDAAQPGDTIRVSAALYQESVVIEKAVSLIGEDRTTTILDGQYFGNTIDVQANNVHIEGFTVSHSAGGSDSAGIVVAHVDNTVITDNIISDNAGHGVFVTGSYNTVTARNLIVSNSESGIHLEGTDLPNTIQLNDVVLNQKEGILLFNAENILVTENTVSNNGLSGITLQGDLCVNNVVQYNTITTNGGNGLALIDASGSNVVVNNVVTQNTQHGVYIANAPHNSLTQNTIADNGQIGGYISNSNETEFSQNTLRNDGIYVRPSFHNTILDNTVNGQPLVYLETTAHQNVSHAGQVVLVNCSDINLRDLDIAHADIAVEFWLADHCTVADSAVADSIYGLRLIYSSNNTLTGNVVTGNRNYGIRLAYSSDNRIGNNTVAGNLDNGVSLDFDSSGNLVEDNTATYNKGGGLTLYLSSNNTLTGNTVDANKFGFYVWNAPNNTFTNNRVTRSLDTGIVLRASSDNRLFGNRFEANTLQVSTVENPVNSLDNGYPSGGNYWSDYSGTDTYSGASQDVPGSDGIGDTPYTIDASNEDAYPLLYSTAPESINVEINGEEYPLVISSNTLISDIDTSTDSLNFTVSGPEGTIGYVHVIFPVIDETALKVYIDGEELVPPPYPLITTNGTHSFIYFEILLSTHDVAIVPVPHNEPPATSLHIGEPKQISDTTYVTPDTPFTLEATDADSGVASTTYRIFNATYTSEWLTYITPFTFISLTDGPYTIEYFSTDTSGNVEVPQACTVTFFSWTYVFDDTGSQGTTLKINTVHKFFQFMSPDNNYGIRLASSIWVRGGALILKHRDSELRLVLAVVNTKRDLCIAMAWDAHARKQYFLFDKAGKE